jgi:PAS domain S-box-containing protein
MTDKGKFNVLYIEDDPSTGLLVGEHLRATGLIMDLAENGATGLRMLEEKEYDAVLLDYRLPDVIGTELLEKITNRPDAPPVVLFTACGDEELAVKAIKLGAVDYVVKDFSSGLENLCQIIRQAALRYEEQRRRKAAENVAHQQSSLLATIADTIPVDLWAGDLSGQCILQSETSKALWGDLLYKPFDSAKLDTSTLERWKENRRRVLRGETIQDEVCFTDINGHEHCFQEILGPIVDDDKTVGMVGLNLDITERKRTEKALRASEEKYRTYIYSAPHAIFLCNLEGRYVDVNPAALRLTGYSREELLSMNITDLDAPEEQDGARERLARLRTEGRLNAEVSIIIKSGERRIVRVHAVKLDRDYIAGFCTDVTEEKQHAEEIERTRTQLQQAQKMEAIGQLAAGIAHEINTPTQFIGDNTHFLKDAMTDISELLSVYNELFRSARDGKPSTEILGRIAAMIEEYDLDDLLQEVPKAIDQNLEGLNRIGGIVSAMKEFAHPGAEDKEVCNVNQAIQTTVTVSRNEWKYVAELETDLAPDLPAIYVRPGGLNQVVLNLVVNAAHAIGDVVEGTSEKGRITIRTRQVDGAVEIRVSDSGGGIPEDVQEKIFDPFFTTKERGKGTGQGLAIIRNIIETKHGGTVRFETEPGQGTTFIITLPTDN